jgi:dephospho-CoA kinase
MIVVGLTGSIGMGKSTAGNMLRDMGIPIHDADATVHKLLAAGGGAVEAVGRLCPEALKLNEEGAPFIDRKALGRHFFSDKQLKADVEGVLYPMVQESEKAFIAEREKEGHRMVVLDVPLLFETGWDKRVDKIICVSAPAEVQKARVMARPGMTEERFNAVLTAQMPDAEKRLRSHYVVDTGVGLEDTRQQLEKIVTELTPNVQPKKTPGPKP